MSEKAHAILSASGSKRWLTCTPSAKLELDFQEEKSVYAEEGTLAHEIGELILSLHLKLITKQAYTRKLNKLKTNSFYSKEMEDYVKVYVDYCIEKINEAYARSKDVVILLEQRLDFSNYVPDGFGTGDLVIISDSILEIVDLKYGKGGSVDATANTQMMLYALGALNQFECLYDIEKLRMTIVQPRLDSISTDEISVEALTEWAESYVKPRAEMAISGEGQFCAGEHCRFCRARYTCRARAEENLKLTRFDFKAPALLSDEEISEILSGVDDLQKWASDIYSYALEQAENHNKKWPGYKLVEGRSSRKYKDENLVAEALVAAGIEEDKLYNKSLLTITAMEKTLGKKQFTELLGELIIKPMGKPTLVSEMDKRPELNSIKSAQSDFAN
ncbi:DUF2800 domain-containing protein [Clostridium butyricum]|uniref:DUF2800 domain-containing protein n=1 Tax=Clostridium butyricum TaxID=1492 RepID=UPI00129A91E6|nr:DUF2800 domain-containing protein [Clostridium butyricum]QGH20206.1 DUF2800 domain-containing protein [Clostridium butyricum]QGH24241.1 DUF2800 domain-containing protein [Clostridium butyricum]